MAGDGLRASEPAASVVAPVQAAGDASANGAPAGVRTAWDGVACPAPAGPHAPRAAERVVVARRGFTALDDAVRPLAVGIAGDRIAWTGDPAQAGDAAHPIAAGAVVDDWGEAFLMPGFHDAHLHFFHAALYASPLADQFLGTSEQDCVDRLADLAARRPAGSWLLAQGWREYRWDPPVTPTRASLDAVYPDRPVALYSGDAHTLWLNSCALERLGITEDAEPPAGGSYDRGADGRLTGIVREAAAMELMPRIVGSFSAEELLDAYRAFQATLNAQGVTAVCDLALMAGPGLDFVRDDLFAALEDAGELTLRVSLFPTLLAEGSRLADLQARLRGPLVRAQGYKQFFDGVSSQHTAWLRDPYANARFPGDCGRPTVAPAVMSALVQRAAAEGQGVRIHAIGDEAIHVALDLYERAGAARPGGGAFAASRASDPAASPVAPAARRAPDLATAPAARRVPGSPAERYAPGPAPDPAAGPVAPGQAVADAACCAPDPAASPVAPGQAAANAVRLAPSQAAGDSACRAPSQATSPDPVATSDPAAGLASGSVASDPAASPAARRALDPAASPVAPVFTLEHLENFQPDDIARLARLGVVASVQPRHMTLDPGGPERDLGPARVPYMWPFRQLLDAGATLAFGTDAPVTPTDPLAAVYAAVTRRDADTREPAGGWLPAEALTVPEALRAYTAGSACAAGRAADLGVLAPGMLADLVVLDRDLTAIDPEAILQTRVLATYVGGCRVYAAG